MPCLLALLLGVAQAGSPPAGEAAGARTIAVDDRLAADAHLRVGDRIVVQAAPGGGGDTVVISAIVRRSADPSEIARGDYHVLMHLDQLQTLLAYGDRVDRFAVATRGGSTTDSAIALINAAAFGFAAHRSRDIAV